MIDGKRFNLQELLEQKEAEMIELERHPSSHPRRRRKPKSGKKPTRGKK